jgi:glutathione S-transferase
VFLKEMRSFAAILLSLATTLTPIKAFSIAMTTSEHAKGKLYDMPVSNNGARCRLIIYKKKVNDVAITSPMELGGLKTPEYLALNPQGKMPLLVVEGGMSIPESDTICRYLLSTYQQGPSFLPNDTKSNLIARIHDMYITTIQGCLYKAAPPFGIFGSRLDAFEELKKQLRVIDDLICEEKDGMYLCGDEVSLGDATLFPTMIFVEHMFPKFGIENAIPAKLAKWYEEVKSNDPDFEKVYNEVSIEKYNPKIHRIPNIT